MTAKRERKFNYLNVGSLIPTRQNESDWEFSGMIVSRKRMTISGNFAILQLSLDY